MTTASAVNRPALVTQLHDEWHGYYMLQRIDAGVYVDVRPLSRAEAVTYRPARDEALEVVWNKNAKENDDCIKT